MAQADWDEVTYIRKKQPKSSQLRSQQAINSAQRQGLTVETSKKYDGGSNRQAKGDKNTAKLDRETEELHHDTVGLDVSKLIQLGRSEKKLTQKDLATKINEKTQVITEYENGRAIPSQQVLAKMERVLGMKLRGKDKGQPLGGPKK
ncbi:endothelial differentiation-related factor 1-like [Ostrea edulis]|uniref:endothelial differentiation-related factor 1-like n=1 Tax=Ostrea edulis TaxID=37623 RepID=UPI00209632AC|nr:endothelial differentiation-related factor 1-like [Ostrea edulis]